MQDQYPGASSPHYHWHSIYRAIKRCRILSSTSPITLVEKELVKLGLVLRLVPLRNQAGVLRRDLPGTAHNSSPHPMVVPKATEKKTETIRVH